tara:strand:- start:141 stop:1403 length:1263 start_codon:yes stop_codon:yes gene_type:complete
MGVSANIVFNIDGLEDCGFVSVSGTWDNWSGWGAHTDTGMTASIPEGNHEFLVLCADTNIVNWSDNIWTSSVVFNAPIQGSCWNGSNEYPNYMLNVSGDTVVSYCAGTCDQNCGSSSSVYNLVWSDEFEENEIDEEKWNFEIGTGDGGWGNGEHQYYTSRNENAFIENGKLIIQAINENYQGSYYTSAKMTTKNKGDWLYGKIKARIKVPNAGGTWPAFWMLPTNSVYGGWPNSGEMDIMEHYGCDPGHVHSTVHNNTYNWSGGIPPTGYSIYTNATSEFHEYEMEWTEDELNFFIDGSHIGSYYNQGIGWQQWPYDQEFFIILNLAVGSQFMSCNTEDSLFPQRYEVDYIRVYQLSEESVISGDVIQDGEVNVLDVVALVEHILFGSNLTIEQLGNGDFTQDGEVNVLDVVAIVEIILE